VGPKSPRVFRQKSYEGDRASSYAEVRRAPKKRFETFGRKIIVTRSRVSAEDNKAGQNLRSPPAAAGRLLSRGEKNKFLSKGDGQISEKGKESGGQDQQRGIQKDRKTEK